MNLWENLLTWDQGSFEMGISFEAQSNGDLFLGNWWYYQDQVQHAWISRFQLKWTESGI